MYTGLVAAVIAQIINYSGQCEGDGGVGGSNDENAKI